MRQRAIILTALVAFVVAVIAAPVGLARRVVNLSENCFAEVEASLKGDTHLCIPSGTTFRFLSHVPWLASDMLLLSETGHARSAHLSFVIATAAEPNASERHRSTLKLAAFGARPLSGTAALQLETSMPGAFESQAGLATESDDKAFRFEGFRGARAVASTEFLRVLLRDADPSDHASRNLQRGALACVLGDRASAANALRAISRRGGDPEPIDTDTRLALIACKLEPAGRTYDPRAVPSEHRHALLSLEASMGRTAALDRIETAIDDAVGDERLVLLSFLLAHQRLDQLAVLTQLAAIGEHQASYASATRSDVENRRYGKGRLHVDLNAVVSAIEQLVSVRAGLGKGPIRCAGADCPPNHVLRQPGNLFEQAETRLLWLAANEAARRSDRGHVLDFAARLGSRLPSRHQYALAGLLLAVDAPEQALAALEASSLTAAELPLADQAGIELNRAEAMRQTGQYRSAAGSARQAFTLLDQGTETATTIGNDSLRAVAQTRRVEAAWLWASLAVMQGNQATILRELKSGRDQEVGDLRRWIELTAMPEPQRRIERAALVLGELPPGAVLPAMVIAGHALPADFDTEIWLDRIFDRIHRQRPLIAMRERFTAAEMRRDRTAARLWRDRLQSSRRALRGSLPETLLTELAGL